MRAQLPFLVFVMTTAACTSDSAAVVTENDATSDADSNGCEVSAGTKDAGACLVACGASAQRNAQTGHCEPVCNIDVEVTARAPGEKTVDCGNLSRTADGPTRERAHHCLLDAVRTGRPVKLVEWMQGTDSQIAYAYVSLGAGGAITRLAYDSNFSGFSSIGGGAISSQTCSSLRAGESCSTSSTAACLECDGDSLRKVCEVAAP